MSDLEKLVNDLEKLSDEDAIVKKLQEIEKALLSNYVIEVGNLTIEPLLIEAYYYNDTKNSFLDCNCHQRPEQKGRFGKLYQHTKTVINGGVDICLSQNKENSEDNYFLSFLIKVALINGKVYKQEAINGELLTLKNIDVEDVSVLKPIKPTNKSVVFVPRKGTYKGKFAQAPLAILSVESFKNEVEAKAISESLEKGCRKQWILAKYALEKSQLDIERARQLVKEEGLYRDRIQDECIDSALEYINEYNK